MAAMPFPDIPPTSAFDLDPRQPRTPFRFKRKRTRTTSSSRASSPKPDSHQRHHHHHHHHRRHHHRRRRNHSPSPPRAPSPFTPDPDPDAAFRESLFDAMADDEGAAYWESVYGQPLHTYSQYYTTTSEKKQQQNTSGRPHPSNGDADEEPNVQKMTEDEYVEFVRRKMWEKSHEYVFEERARRRRMEEERRQKEKSKEKEMAGEGRRSEWREGEEVVGKNWQEGVEEALRRGEERRRRAKWRAVWEDYIKGWEGMKWGDRTSERKGTVEAKRVGLLRERIPWPVESGKWKDVGKDGVEVFFGKAPTAAAAVGGQAVDLGEVLKKERVRWHPDKVQQRAGAGGIDVETLKTVTAIFQVVDRMWREIKGRKG